MSYIKPAVALLFLVCFTSASANFNDQVLVIVNEDVITQSEFDDRLKTVVQTLDKNTPPELLQTLPEQLLDGMITDRLQMQEAKRRGIEVGDEELDLAMQRYAAQQKRSIEQIIAEQGQSYNGFRKTVHDSLVVSRLNEYYAQSRVIVPEYEIDGFIAQNKLDQGDTEYQIAHILLSNNDENKKAAQQIVDRVRSSMGFGEAAKAYSQAPDAAQGGVIGWRRAAQLPEVFNNALKEMKVGDVSDVLESPNGLHILKVLNRKGNYREITQRYVLHILISAKSKVAQSQAAKRLMEIRERILAGEDFSQLARVYSDDSVSAAIGGSLEWVSPGQMVPAFEEAYKKLAIDEVSQPVVTQYGVHLIKVIDERVKNVTQQVIRARAESILRQQRAEREFQQWVRGLKGQAYIKEVAQPVVKIPLQQLINN